MPLSLDEVEVLGLAALGMELLLLGCCERGFTFRVGFEAQAAFNLSALAKLNDDGKAVSKQESAPNVVHPSHTCKHRCKRKAPKLRAGNRKLGLRSLMLTTACRLAIGKSDTAASTAHPSLLLASSC